MVSHMILPLPFCRPYKLFDPVVYLDSEKSVSLRGLAAITCAHMVLLIYIVWLYTNWIDGNRFVGQYFIFGNRDVSGGV